MIDFFFESWPHGVGPAIIQLGLLIAGAAAGIRLTDDARRALIVIRSRRPQD